MSMCQANLPPMRSSLLLVFCLGLGLALFLGCTEEDQDPATAPRSNIEAQPGEPHEVEPEPIPDLTLQTLEGETIDLSQRRGEVLLINFWATWCTPCREEIPDLVSLQSDLGPQGLTIIGIALDRDGEEAVNPFLDEYEVNYPIVIDADRSVESEIGPTYGLPTTLVVNPEGEITHRVVGIFPVEEMQPSLEEMLASAEGDQE